MRINSRTKRCKSIFYQWHHVRNASNLATYAFCLDHKAFQKPFFHSTNVSSPYHADCYDIIYILWMIYPTLQYTHDKFTTFADSSVLQMKRKTYITSIHIAAETNQTLLTQLCSLNNDCTSRPKRQHVQVFHSKKIVAVSK
jgi:hypothetical protein